MLKEKTGYFLVLLTAIISGFSIFLNKFAVQGSNPFIFTALKNITVAVFLFSIILLIKELPAIKTMQKKNWLKLAIIGLAGGSVPFLMFFYALTLTSAVSAGFLQKTIFIFATMFAIIFLKEKIGKTFLMAAGLLLLGNFFFSNLVSSFALPDLLVLGAAILWGLENTISKNALKELSGSTVAFGRMFFGAIFIFIFLALTGQMVLLGSVPLTTLEWVLITAVPLLLYVLTFYSGLKTIPVSKATAILMLGQPITIALSFAFIAPKISINEGIGIILTLTGMLLLFASSYAIIFSKAKGFLLARTGN